MKVPTWKSKETAAVKMAKKIQNFSNKKVKKRSWSQMIQNWIRREMAKKNLAADGGSGCTTSKNLCQEKTFLFFLPMFWD